jgi:hypothetical protein
LLGSVTIIVVVLKTKRREKGSKTVTTFSIVYGLALMGRVLYNAFALMNDVFYSHGEKEE